MKKALLVVWLLLATIVFANDESAADATSPYIDSIVGKEKHVNDTIAGLIGAAGPGDTVRVALYFGIRTPGQESALWLALKNAVDSGVTVQIVTEGKLLDDARNPWSTAAAQAIRQYFVSLELAGADVTYCDEGCTVDRRDDQAAANNPNITSNNHHKFFMIDAGTQTIIQSSANDWVGSGTGTHGEGRYEQAIVLDADFYENIWKQYLNKFEAMRGNWKDGQPGYSSSQPSKWRQATAFLGPYASSEADDYLQALQWAKPGPDCAIRIVMGHWSRSVRTGAIADRLNELVAGGCSVDAIHGGNVSASMSNRTNIDFELEYQSNVHAKFVTLKYKNNAGVLRKFVYAGSHNFTKGNLLYDDDAMVFVSRDEIYADFCAYFGTIESSEIGSHHSLDTSGNVIQATGSC